MAFKFGAGASSLRPVLFFLRFMQWASAVIIMGIASYYIHQYSPEGEHIIYAEVIVSLPSLAEKSAQHQSADKATRLPLLLRSISSHWLLYL